MTISLIRRKDNPRVANIVALAVLLCSLATQLTAQEFSQDHASCGSVTISFPRGLADSLETTALQLSNEDASIDPAYPPRRLVRNTFQFRLAPSEDTDLLITNLRAQGLLVNPVYEYAVDRFILYTDRITVAFKPGLELARRDSVHAEIGCETVDENRLSSNKEIVEIVNPNGRSSFDVARAYAAIEECEFAVPQVYITTDFNDLGDPHSYTDLQWPFDNRGQSGGATDADVDAPYAWRISKGSGSAQVAVLDCFFCPHPDTVTPESNIHYYDVNYSSDSFLFTCGSCTTVTADSVRREAYGRAGVCVQKTSNRIGSRGSHVRHRKHPSIRS